MVCLNYYMYVNFFSFLDFSALEEFALYQLIHDLYILCCYQVERGAYGV